MILKEKTMEMEMNRGYVEYLASFWNHEAVVKIQEQRAAAKQHAFKSDSEFEKSVLDESYKNIPLVKALQELRKTEQTQVPVKKDKTKPVTNLSALKRIIDNY